MNHVFAPGHRQAGKGPAFTLVEMLVSVAVLCLLILMLAQMVGLSSQAIAVNMKKLDAVGQARLVFDRIGVDLAARPRRSDLGMLFTKAVGNDSFQFYSEMDGYSGTRHIATIGYRIQQATAGRLYQLERGATGSDWASGGNSLVFSLQLPSSQPSSSSTLSPPAEADYEVLAKGVFRLEFCYLLNAASAANTSTQLSNTANGDYSNVSGLVVALAVLDDKSRAILTDAQVQQLSGALQDSVEGQYPISAWSAALNQSDFAAGIPRQAVQGIHIYQRVFNVP